MNIFEIFGWGASISSILMFLPQTIKVMKTKSTNSISQLTYILLTFGLSMGAIFAPLVNSLQAWSANVIILLLTFPIMWFMFKNKKWLLILITVWILFAIVISTMFVMYELGIHLYAKYLFILLAGSSTGFAFMPQSIKTFKSKDVSDNSLLTTLLVIGSNILWVVYWVGVIMASSMPNTPLNSLSLLFATTLLLFQLPILYVFWEKKKA